jgi:DivIVA domain-containing protein
MNPSGSSEQERPEETLARLQREESARQAAEHSQEVPAARPAAANPPPAREEFGQVRLREGYAIDAVDAFFDHIETRSADEVRDAQFPVTRLRNGYNMDDVDRSLDRWEKWLRSSR